MGERETGDRPSPRPLEAQTSTGAGSPQSANSPSSGFLPRLGPSRLSVHLPLSWLSGLRPPSPREPLQLPARSSPLMASTDPPGSQPLFPSLSSPPRPPPRHAVKRFLAKRPSPASSHWTPLQGGSPLAPGPSLNHARLHRPYDNTLSQLSSPLPSDPPKPSRCWGFSRLGAEALLFSLYFHSPGVSGLEHHLCSKPPW